MVFGLCIFLSSFRQDYFFTEEINIMDLILKTCRFSEDIINGLESYGLLVDYCDVFISCLEKSAQKICPDQAPFTKKTVQNSSNIVMFYQLFGHSFQILTAPIDCRGSTGEQVMQCYMSPDLFWWQIQTPLHLRWPAGWVHFQQTFIFEWTISLRMVALRSK